jgi:hypothetical protein
MSLDHLIYSQLNPVLTCVVHNISHTCEVKQHIYQLKLSFVVCCMCVLFGDKTKFHSYLKIDMNIHNWNVRLYFENIIAFWNHLLEKLTVTHTDFMWLTVVPKSTKHMPFTPRSLICPTCVLKAPVMNLGQTPETLSVSSVAPVRCVKIGHDHLCHHC